MIDSSNEEPNILIISFEGRFDTLSMKVDRTNAINEAPVAPKRVGCKIFRNLCFFSSFNKAFEQIGQLRV